jgi:A/G-specific adenine glycosylase
VLPYYARFLRRFPTIETLAKAREHDVLPYWAGLGYYSRARNLHRTAKEIVANHAGEFPREQETALALPGIGTYTAAAVLSISYDVPLAVIDGNVSRVLARLDAVRGDIRAPKTWARLASDAQKLLDIEAAGDWNQALMELGEVICTPRSPDCTVCPLSKFCRTRALGLSDSIPAPRRQRATVCVKIAAAVLLDRKRRTLLLRDPGAHDRVLFSGMWQFPAVEVKRDPISELKAYLAQTLGVSTDGFRQLPNLKHAVTFRNVTLVPFLVPLDGLPAGKDSRLIVLDKISTLPISSATLKIAKSALRSIAQSLGAPSSIQIG